MRQLSLTTHLPAKSARQARCENCLGERIDPATGRACLRCGGSGKDPDPLAPTAVTPLTRAGAIAAIAQGATP
jgi:hypothetical protein